MLILGDFAGVGYVPMRWVPLVHRPRVAVVRAVLILAAVAALAVGVATLLHTTAHAEDISSVGDAPASGSPTAISAATAPALEGAAVPVVQAVDSTESSAASGSSTAPAATQSTQATGAPDASTGGGSGAAGTQSTQAPGSPDASTGGGSGAAGTQSAQATGSPDASTGGGSGAAGTQSAQATGSPDASSGAVSGAGTQSAQATGSPDASSGGGSGAAGTQTAQSTGSPDASSGAVTGAGTQSALSTGSPDASSGGGTASPAEQTTSGVTPGGSSVAPAPSPGTAPQVTAQTGPRMSSCATSPAQAGSLRAGDRVDSAGLANASMSFSSPPWGSLSLPAALLVVWGVPPPAGSGSTSTAGSWGAAHVPAGGLPPPSTLTQPGPAGSSLGPRDFGSRCGQSGGSASPGAVLSSVALPSRVAGSCSIEGPSPSIGTYLTSRIERPG